MGKVEELEAEIRAWQGINQYIVNRAKDELAKLKSSNKNTFSEIKASDIPTVAKAFKKISKSKKRTR